MHISSVGVIDDVARRRPLLRAGETAGYKRLRCVDKQNRWNKQNISYQGILNVS